MALLLTNDNLDQTPLISAYPFTYACWVQPTATISANSCAMSMSSTSGTENFFALTASATGNMRGFAQTGAGTSSVSTSASTVTAGSFHHCVSVFTSATSVLCYLDGVVSPAGTTSIAFSGVSTMTLGCLYLNTATPTQFWNGTIAYPAFWNSALSAANVASLYNSGAGVDPSTIASASLVSFSKLQSGPPYLDTGAGTTWTLTGSPTIAADPFSLGASSLTDRRFGFATHFEQGWSVNLMPLIAATGVGYIRDDLLTSRWEPTVGNFVVPAADVTWINSAHANGLLVVGIIGKNTTYPSGDPYDPQLMANRAAFIAANGNVDVIEVTNEPNNDFQTTEGSATWEAKLAALTTACTNAVNAVAPNVTVIGLGAQGNQIISILGSTTVDGIVYHPYDNDNQTVGTFIPETVFEGSFTNYEGWLGNIMAATPLPLWETEWGTQTVTGFSQDNQACFLARRMLISMACAVDHTFIYEFRDNSSTDLYGVYDITGTTAKASYAVVTRLIAALRGVVGSRSFAVPASSGFANHLFGVTLNSVANGNTAQAYGCLYKGASKTVVASWFGNTSPTAPPAASTCSITFPVHTGFTVAGATVLNVVAGTSVALSTFTTSLVGSNLTVSNLTITDHPLLIIGGTAFNTVSVNFSQAVASADVSVLEYTGINNVNPAASASTGTSVSPLTSVTTTVANDVLLGAATSLGGPLTPGTGFSTRALTSRQISEDKTAGAAGSNSAGATLASSSGWVMQVLALKSTAAAVGITVRTSGIVTGEAHGTLTVATGVRSVLISGISTGDDEGSTQVVRGNVNVSLSGIGTSEDEATLLVARGVRSVLISGISTQESFGQTDVSDNVALSISGISTSEDSALMTVLNSDNVFVSGIPTAEDSGLIFVTPNTRIATLGIQSTESFGATKVAAGAIISINGISTSEDEGSLTVNVAFTMLDIGISTGENFATVLVNQSTSIHIIGISTSEDEANVLVVANAIINLLGMPTSEDEGTILAARGGSTLVINGIATQEAIGATTLAGFGTISISGITTSESFGVTTVNAVIPISITGIPTAEDSGLIFVTPNTRIVTLGIQSTESFGNTAVINPAVININGIPTAESEGLFTVNAPNNLLFLPIPTAESFSPIIIFLGSANVVISGISSQESLGTLVVSGGGSLSILGIPTLESFGLTKVDALATIPVTGISSAEALGLTIVNFNATVKLLGIPTAEQFGTNHLSFPGFPQRMGRVL